MSRADAATRDAGTRCATGWYVAAIDQAIGRLSTVVGRMDGIDLAGPWTAGEPTRRARVLALVDGLDRGSAPSDSVDGGPLAAALVRAWFRRREAHMAVATIRGQRSLMTVLDAVHDVHVAIDAGVARNDIPQTVPVP